MWRSAPRSCASCRSTAHDDRVRYLLHHIALSLPNLAGLAGAGLACGYAVIQIGRALLARRWPTVEGEIVDARMVRVGDRQRTSSSLRLGRVIRHVELHAELGEPACEVEHQSA
jgi:hypothetical protein